MEQELEQSCSETPTQQLQTSTPFVHAVVSQQPSQDASFARLEASSIAEVSQDSNGVESTTDTNMSMNTALMGSFTDERASLNDPDVLTNIDTPEQSGNQLNKGFCSDSSVVMSKSQEEESSNSDEIQNPPQLSSTDKEIAPSDHQEDKDNTTTETVVDSNLDHNDEQSHHANEQCCGLQTDNPTSESCDLPHNAENPCTLMSEGTEKAVQVSSETAVTGDQEAMDAGTMSENHSQKSTTQNTIYLNTDEDKAPPPKTKAPKRLTMAQRAAMEALASFGGSDFASISVKKRDLRSKLKRDSEDTVDQPPAKRPRTRLQMAQEEAQTMFKDVPFGKQSRRDDQVSLDTSSDQPAPPPARRMTRLERAKLEALQSFGGSGFGDLMDGAKRRVARTLERKVKGETKEGDDTAEGNTCEGKENEADTVVATVQE